jgi:hypothetical protein
MLIISCLDGFVRFSGFLVLVLISLLSFSSCDRKDPEPVNEEEVITTVEVTLTPVGGGAPVTLKFLDEDGEQGSITPVITVSGPLQASTRYGATIRFLNETSSPTEDISAEVEEEGNDHLICFDPSQNIVITYGDMDDNGLPLGLTTSWLTGNPGDGEVSISLRHQAGTKTGDCPGPGETDVEVTFNLTIE